MISGDVELNPGPFWKKEDDPIENLQNIIDEQADEISDLKDTIDKQGETIDDLKAKISELSDQTTKIEIESHRNEEDILKFSRALEKEKKENSKKFEELSEHDSKFGQELLQQKVQQDLFPPPL